MTEITRCNLCDHPSTIDDATDVATVPCDVRRFQHEQFLVWRCRHCDSIHAGQDVDLDHYYRDYFLHHQKLDFVTRTIYRRYLRTMKRYGLTKNQSILDYGCGNGKMVKVLQQSGYAHTCGYDPYVEEFADPQVLKATYDAVVSCEVIEHVNDTLEYLRGIVAQVRPGGLVVIATPNASGINLQESGRYQWGLHQPFHRRILSQQIMEPLGRQAGLRQVYSTCRNWDTLWPTVNLRFIVEYIRAAGNMADTAVEKPRTGMVLTSPRLLFYAMYGYFFSPGSSMLSIFRKES